jgi:hypothetical protein
MMLISVSAWALLELWQYVPELLRAPVGVYALLITLMGCFIIAKHKTRCVISGIIALNLSDLLAAVDLWVTDAAIVMQVGHMVYFWANLNLVLGESSVLGCAAVAHHDEVDDGAKAQAADDEQEQENWEDLAIRQGLKADSSYDAALARPPPPLSPQLTARSQTALLKAHAAE